MFSTWSSSKLFIGMPSDEFVLDQYVDDSGANAAVSRRRAPLADAKNRHVSKHSIRDRELAVTVCI